jgi:micrococcal nuclease
MRRLFPIVLLMLLAAPVQALELRGTVDFVPDGDTVVLKDGEVVRLLGIDAPETGKDGEPDRYFAQEAGRALESWTLGREVRIRTAAIERDDYGRVLGLVFLPDGRSANEMLLRRGLAFYFHFPTHPEWLEDSFTSLQAGAVRDGRGFWPKILSLPKARRPWIGFPDSRRARPAGKLDRSGARRRNLAWFPDLEAVFLAGFCPARSSRFWPAEN